MFPFASYGRMALLLKSRSTWGSQGPPSRCSEFPAVPLLWCLGHPCHPAKNPKWHETRKFPDFESSTIFKFLHSQQMLFKTKIHHISNLSTFQASTNSHRYAPEPPVLRSLVEGSGSVGSKPKCSICSSGNPDPNHWMLPSCYLILCKENHKKKQGDVRIKQLFLVSKSAPSFLIDL